MNYYRFPENRLTKLSFPLILLVLQMVARSTMYTSTFLGFELSQVLMIATIGLVGLTFLWVNRRNLKQVLTDQRMLLFAVCTVVILLPMLVKQDWQLMYFSILLCWLFAVFLTYFTTTEELGRCYVLLMAMLGFFSLVGVFVLKPLTQAGIVPGNPFKSPGSWTMYNYGLAFVSLFNEHGDNTMRAFGIFREPGLYQIFLFIAIHLNNDVAVWNKPWKMWAVDAILFLAMLTTFATGGVLALGLYVLFLFFDKGLYRRRSMQLLLAAAILAFAAFVVYSIRQGGTWAYELVGMMEKIFEKRDSYTARTDSIVADATLFFTHPVFGARISEVMYSVPNNTCSSPIFFAAFGIVGGCIHVLGWMALAWKKERPVVLNLILMVILFVPFNTQNVVADLFFWLFPMMALAEKCLIWLNDRKKKVA